MGNKIRSIGLLFVFLSAFLFTYRYLPAAELMIAGFQNDGKSDLGTDIGTWDSNPMDTSQGCAMEIIQLYGVLGKENDETRVLKLSYDVASTNPAFNGLYIKLNNVDLSAYDEMSMVIKGDPQQKFTTQFKIELKNSKGERAMYVLKGITDQWQKLSIPLGELKSLGSITDWTKMSEIVFTFDDMTCDYKQGVIYVDDIKFSSKQ